MLKKNQIIFHLNFLQILKLCIRKANVCHYTELKTEGFWVVDFWFQRDFEILPVFPEVTYPVIFEYFLEYSAYG